MRGSMGRGAPAPVVFDEADLVWDGANGEGAVMTETLKSCPFCGGDAKEFTGEDAAPHRWTVECDSCGAHVGSDTRHKARAKWNRRAERTAAIEVFHGRHGPEPLFPGDALTMHHACSACGGAVDGGDRYCKHCGASFEEEA